MGKTSISNAILASFKSTQSYKDVETDEGTENIALGLTQESHYRDAAASIEREFLNILSPKVEDKKKLAAIVPDQAMTVSWLRTIANDTKEPEILSEKELKSGIAKLWKNLRSEDPFKFMKYLNDKLIFVDTNPVTKAIVEKFKPEDLWTADFSENLTIDIPSNRNEDFDILKHTLDFHISGETEQFSENILKSAGYIIGEETKPLQDAIKYWIQDLPPSNLTKSDFYFNLKLQLSELKEPSIVNLMEFFKANQKVKEAEYRGKLLFNEIQVFRTLKEQNQVETLRYDKFVNIEDELVKMAGELGQFVEIYDQNTAILNKLLKPIPGADFTRDGKRIFRM